MILQCKSISRQIRGWTNSLQNSDIKGQRHLNDTTRQSYERGLRQDAFMQRQRKFRELQEARLLAAAAERNQSPDGKALDD